MWLKVQYNLSFGIICIYRVHGRTMFLLILVNMIKMNETDFQHSTLSHSFLPFYFCAEIVIRSPVIYFVWYQYRIIEHTSKFTYIYNEMMDTLKIVRNFWVKY